MSDKLQMAREALERWAVVRETVLDVGLGDDVRTGGRPELGYALIANPVTFLSEDEAREAIRSAGLPIGWVVMPLSRLLPDALSLPDAAQDMPSLPNDLIDLIAEYGMARTDGVSDVERIHRWQMLIKGIKSYARSALAAPSAHPDAQPVAYIAKTGHGTRFRENLDGVAPEFAHMWKALRYCAQSDAQPVQAQDEPVAEIGKGPVMSFTRLTEYGLSLPPGQYKLYTRSQAVAAKPWAEQDDPRCNDGSAACADCIAFGECMVEKRCAVAAKSDEDILKIVHDIHATGRITLTATNGDGKEVLTDIAKCFIRALGIPAKGDA